MAAIALDHPWLRIDVLVLAAARLGYAARGFVYLSVGVLSALAALDLEAAARGSRGSMAVVAQAPLGSVWLTLVAIGLLCFAGWRGLQAVLDADRQGRRPKALAQRAAQGLSGLIYGALAISLFELLDELADVREADEAAGARRTASELLGMPFGDWLLIAAGLFVIGAGVGNVLHALERRFHSDLDCSQLLRSVAKPIGRAGYLARGAAFAATGFYLTRAGLDVRSSEAKDMGGALQALEAQPGGSMLLLLIAAGLVAFGLFGLVEARYRVVRAPKEVR